MDRDRQIEQLKKKLEELQARYDFLLASVDHLPNPIFMKDEDAHFFFFNKAYSEFFNMNQSEYIGATVLDLDYLPEEDRKRFHSDALDLIASQQIVTYDANFQTPEGVDRPTFYWSCGFRDDATGRPGLVGEIVDISKERELQKSLDESVIELKSVNRKLKIMAETDHASGLYNRSVMWDKGNRIVEKCRRTSDHACMIMFDLDKFKHINDEFGHLKGDEILLEFSRILRSECRISDLPVRYGGDEFLLILDNIELDNAASVAERIRARAEKELILPDGSSLTVSVGIIEIDKNGSFEDNLNRLDTYLYEAKAQGRNRVARQK